MRRKRLNWIAALLFLVALIGGLGWMTQSAIHQERINRALISAIKNNDTKTALALLDEGADPNSQDDTPQHLPLWRLLLDMLRGKRFAPSHAPTALLVALGDYQVDNWRNVSIDSTLISALLDRGAEVNARDENGGTPLLWALNSEESSERDHAIMLLLKHGANVNEAENHGFTPFSYALYQAQPLSETIFDAILSRGANVNEKINGRTPLSWAIEAHEPSVIKLLLLHGANPNIKDEGGYTVLAVAKKEYPYRPVLQMLKQAGAMD